LQTLSEVNVSELLSSLREKIRGEVNSTSLKRAEYSTDASNYRVLPAVVVIPLDKEDVIAALEIARKLDIPLTLRGGGTSVAGNSIGSGIIVDTSVHMNKVLEINPEEKTAKVQPGVILDALQKEAAKFGLRFGPDPSTQSRATLGGMIANNACGAHALAYGKTADNVVELEIIDGRGRIYTASNDLSAVDGLNELVMSNLATIRTEFGTFARQVSGYSLEHLLPEKKNNLAAMLAGTEGTLGIVLEATVKLVPMSKAPALVVLGYPTMADAADDVPNLTQFKPLAMEGMDSNLVDVAHRHSAGKSFPELPSGNGWLMIEVGGDTPEMAMSSAEKLVSAATTKSVKIYPAGKDASALWRLRSDGAGYAGRTASDKQAWPGWEDAAVPPKFLGTYLRKLDVLMDKYGLSGLPFGHFGDGCVHVRIDFPLENDGEVMRNFILEATDLVLSLGGSPSGEHGDGRARSELLSKMYSKESLALFSGIKELFDPQNILNPGVIVHPEKLDIDLRRPRAVPIASNGGFAFHEDEGSFTNAVHRCVGVGKCRADNSASGGFMCPSYLATNNETDVTRGRSRVLQEMASGNFSKGKKLAWDSDEVSESLDLCLSCKACVSDCPAGVDMAKYKSEVLFRKYKGKIRPISHYTLGKLPFWAKFGKKFPKLVNAVTSSFLRPIILSAGGMDGRRLIPKFSEDPFVTSQEARNIKSGKPPIVLWVDTFSGAFTSESAFAAVELLENCGYEVIIPSREACCGLTAISTGQLSEAKRTLINLLDTLGPYVEQGLKIVGLEPSCTAVLRSDLLDLLPEDSRSIAVSKATQTLAETVLYSVNSDDLNWQAPDLSVVEVIVQPHCHQHSVTGFDSDKKLLEKTGIKFTMLAGCCGLAGNFGMEKGHYETSVAVAENALLPAIRKASTGTYLLADGFSCRTQADQLGDIKSVTLAQLLTQKI